MRGVNARVVDCYRDASARDGEAAVAARDVRVHAETVNAYERVGLMVVELYGRVEVDRA